MKLFKAKAPFFSGGYYKELLRELRVFAIIALALQFIHGLAGEFGLSFAMGPISLLEFAFGGIRMNHTHADVFILYFFVCALNFSSTHISRKNWDFRNNLPVAKRTMFVCHFAAVMTYALAIFAVNYVGVLTGEGMRLFIRTLSLPDGFGMSAVSMLKNIVTGVSCYCALVILASLINKVFSEIAAIGTVFCLPLLFSVLTHVLRIEGMNTWSLLFPLGIAGASRANTILSVLGMLILMVLAYIAFGKSRVETFMKPARTKWIHIMIGVLGASCVGMFAAGICAATATSRYASFGKPIYEMPEFYGFTLIYGGISMLVAYFVYMWITLKSFKGALKRCVYVPLAFLVIGAAVLTAYVADKKWEKLDVTAGNIESVRVSDVELTGEGGYGMFSAMQGALRGSSHCFDVELKDEKSIKAAAEIAEYAKNGTSRGAIISVIPLFDVVFNGLEESGTVEITLKSGEKLVVNDRHYQFNLAALQQNEAFIEKRASLDRFKNGKVLEPAGIGSKLEETLLDELASLPAFERAQLLSGERVIDEGTVIDGSMDFGWYETHEFRNGGSGAFVTLSSATYDHACRIELSDKLPKTMKLYMKLVSELMRNHKNYGEFITRLKNADFSAFTCNSPLSGSVSEYASAYIYNGAPFTDERGSYIPEVKELCALIAEVLEENRPIDGTDEIFGLCVNAFMADDPAKGGYYIVRSLFGSEMSIFVGVSSEKAERLKTLFDKLMRLQPGIMGFEEFVSAIADAIDNELMNVYDDAGNELMAKEFLDLFYNKGCEFFCDESGAQWHITELYDMLTANSENTL